MTRLNVQHSFFTARARGHTIAVILTRSIGSCAANQLGTVVEQVAVPIRVLIQARLDKTFHS